MTGVCAVVCSLRVGRRRGREIAPQIVRATQLSFFLSSRPRAVQLARYSQKHNGAPPHSGHRAPRLGGLRLLVQPAGARRHAEAGRQQRCRGGCSSCLAGGDRDGGAEEAAIEDEDAAAQGERTRSAAKRTLATHTHEKPRALTLFSRASVCSGSPRLGVRLRLLSTARRASATTRSRTRSTHSTSPTTRRTRMTMTRRTRSE